jgi:hypothetical protein
MGGLQRTASRRSGICRSYDAAYQALLNEQNDISKPEKPSHAEKGVTAQSSSSKLVNIERIQKIVANKYKLYLNRALTWPDPLIALIADDLYRGQKNISIANIPRLEPMSIPNIPLTPITNKIVSPDAEGHIPWANIRGTKWDGLNFELGQRSSMQDIIDRAPDDSVIIIPEGTYYGSIALHKRHRLTLRGKPDTTRLILKETFKDIIVINDCEDIRIEGLGLSHEVSNQCQGDVIVIHNSRQVSVASCDISGSGVTGIKASNVWDLNVDGCYFHDCSDAALNFNILNNSSIRNNLFSNNPASQYTGIKLFSVIGKMDISNNTFAHNASNAITVFKSIKYVNPFALIKISNNIFSYPQLPKGRKLIFDHADQIKRNEWQIPGMATFEITDNCFEIPETTSIEEIVSPGAAMKNNSSLKIEFGSDFNVIAPEECRGKGAKPLFWFHK